MLGTPTHTLRYYERIGIISPSRSSGNIRLYSETDIAKLRRIKELIDELGINLAGAEVIMRMAERMSYLQQQVEDLEHEIEQLKNKTIIED
jgi:MerR family transcriptional regulator/heat shock protein HspR